MRFVERREFSGNPADVWARVSDLGAVPSYWHGTKEFRVRVEGGKTKADVVFAFGGSGSAEVVIDERSKRLVINFVRGPFRGAQTVVLTGKAVEAEWDINFNWGLQALGAVGEVPLQERHAQSPGETLLGFDGHLKIIPRYGLVSR